MIIGGIILVVDFIILVMVAQTAISDIRRNEYTLGPKEIMEIKEKIENSQFFSGIYVVEILEPPDISVHVEIRDPDGTQIISRESNIPFVIDSFDVKNDGLYIMTVENFSSRDVIRVAVALGGQVYSGSVDPMIAVAIPSYIAIIGIIIIISGAAVYYKERLCSGSM